MSTSDQARNREAWLTDFIALAMPLIKQRCPDLSQGERKIKISCGFPSSGAKPRKNGNFTTGQCHHTEGTDRKYFQIFIHPGRTSPLLIGETVIHELLHALLPGGAGHRKPFSQAMKKVGLVGKPTSTELGPELQERVQEIVDQLGPYPHEALMVEGGMRRNPLLKAMCPTCGYLIRVTNKWIEEAGYPICPQCNVEMQGADVGDQATDPLHAIDQTVEYRTKLPRTKPTDPIFDPRWSIFMHRKGTRMEWKVVDYGPPVIDGRAVLGTPQPRMTPAESREDAIALMEALREGTMTYRDIEPDPEEFDDGDWFDESPDHLAEDEPEAPDFEDHSDPRFPHEIAQGFGIEDIDPELEAERRENR